MRKQSWFILLCAGTLKVSVGQTCADGFESNSFAGWTGAIGQNNGSYSITITSVGTASPNFGIETATTIPCSNSISSPTVYEPLAAPGFGQYSARLGQVATAGAKVEMLTYTFVPSVSDTNFTYVYSTYLQAPGHGPTDNPFFIIGMLDQYGDTIPGSYYQYETGTPSVAGFDTSQCSSMLLFKPWTIRGVNLSPYVGQPVVLFAINADCAPGGHYAYSYVDMDCDGILNVPYQSTVLLNAGSEPGSAYLWNTGATTPAILVNNPVPNSIYWCKVTLPAYYSGSVPNYTFLVQYKIMGNTGIKENKNDIKPSFYPNPAKDVLYVNENLNLKDIKIYNIMGQVVKHVYGNEKRIDISALSEGVFFVEYKMVDNNMHVEKLLIQK